MAWSQPSRSRPGQGRWESLDSGGAAGGWRAGSSGSGMGLMAGAGTGAHLGEVLPIPPLQVPPMRLGVPSATQDCI